MIDCIIDLNNISDGTSALKFYFKNLRILYLLNNTALVCVPGVCFLGCFPVTFYWDYSVSTGCIKSLCPFNLVLPPWIITFHIFSLYPSFSFKIKMYVRQAGPLSRSNLIGLSLEGGWD